MQTIREKEITVSDAGSSEVNGVYTRVEDCQGKPQYSRIADGYTYKIYWPSYRGKWSLDGAKAAGPNEFVIYNNYYTNSAQTDFPPEDGWEVGVIIAGKGPPPVLKYEDSRQTENSPIKEY